MPKSKIARAGGVCDKMYPMRTYTIVVEPEDGGGYFVTVPALPGCFTRGSTIDECRERAVEADRGCERPERGSRARCKKIGLLPNPGFEFILWPCN